ncbi:unnamed protein product [Adineta ricciae]|uniref:Uncharacterized protein n=1 Tax=Adineta ricciae TaxID=249248 RepID=A0A813MUC1_ADIRI|nr:unnamed protein product [Adineta ricciae]CAF0966159.1 unnamed protein product [Adineta ricciae]
MPRKNAMRDNVSAVRSRLPDLMNLSREKIELALLYYESNVDETVEAFKRNGAMEALNGWTEMNNNRGNNSNKRGNNKSSNGQKKSSSQTLPSNGILRPSQRVSNIFQTFAEGGIPTITTNGISTTTINSPSSLSSSSLHEQSNNHLQSCLSTDLSFHPYFSQDSTTNHSESSSHPNESTRNEYHDTSNVTTNSSTTTDESNLLTNHTDEDTESTNGHNGKLKRRKNNSKYPNLDQTQETSSNDAQPITTTTTTTVTKPSTSTNGTTFISDNRKILTRPSKDLQRQTSTLTNVESSFEHEIKSSIKRIDDVFKQIREIIKEREIELYLEMDKVKAQGLNIIHRRQKRASELRQRVDSCDRLEQLEIDLLRTDIKNFVTDRRYDLCEELTSLRRFEYDQAVIEALKNFGTVLRIDRKQDRARTLSTSSALVEQNGTSISPLENNTSENSIEHNSELVTNGRVFSSSSLSSNEPLSSNHQQALPQRITNKAKLNGNIAGDSSPMTSQTNGHHNHYDDSNNYQTVNRRRVAPSQQQYPPYQNGNNHRRTRAIPSNNTSQTSRRNGFNNSETTNTYRRPRPPPQTMISPISN